MEARILLLRMKVLFQCEMAYVRHLKGLSVRSTMIVTIFHIFNNFKLLKNTHYVIFICDHIKVRKCFNNGAQLNCPMRNVNTSKLLESKIITLILRVDVIIMV